MLSIRSQYLKSNLMRVHKQVNHPNLYTNLQIIYELTFRRKVYSKSNYKSHPVKEILILNSSSYYFWQKYDRIIRMNGIVNNTMVL